MLLVGGPVDTAIYEGSDPMMLTIDESQRPDDAAIDEASDQMMLTLTRPAARWC